MKLLTLTAFAFLAQLSLAEKVTTIVDVIDSDTFEEYAIADTTKHAFVEFWAPWCGHCKTFSSKWDTISLNLRGSDVKIAKLNAKENKELAKKLRVHAYPKLLLFTKDAKDKPLHYKGKKSEAEIMNWLHREIGLERKAGMQFTRQAGRVRSLDLLARKFMKASSDKRSEIAVEVKAKEDAMQHKNAKYVEIYTEVMQGVLAQGEKYLFLQQEKLQRALKEPLDLEPHKWENYAKMLNIVREFLPYVHKKEKRKHIHAHKEVEDHHVEELHKHRIHDEL